MHLSVREGRKLGGPCKLFLTNPIFKNCSSGKSISTGLSSRYHCGFDFAVSVFRFGCILCLLAVVLVVSPCIVMHESLFSFISVVLPLVSSVPLSKTENW